MYLSSASIAVDIANCSISLVISVIRTTACCPAVAMFQPPRTEQKENMPPFFFLKKKVVFLVRCCVESEGERGVRVGFLLQPCIDNHVIPTGITILYSMSAEAYVLQKGFFF